MEYIQGEPLSAIFAATSGGLPEAQARDWFLQAAHAVAYLHDHAVVHRDIKPGNLFVENGVVKLGDYGLSKSVGRQPACAKSVYAMDDADREAKTKHEFKTGAKVEVSRFKGLGEMPPAQLKETTMDPARRTLLKVVVPDERARTTELVENLMGRRPELRFQFMRSVHAR